MGEDNQGLEVGLRSADLGLQKIEYASALVGAAVVFLLMFGGVAEVLLRSIFNSPIPGYIEAVQVGVVAFAILPISYCYQRDGHLKMDLLIRNTTGRTNWVLKAVATAIALVFIWIILPSVFDFFRNSFVLGDSTMNMDWPIWPSKIAAVVGLAILGLRLALELAALLRMVANPDAVPIALPKPHDPIVDAVD